MIKTKPCLGTGMGEEGRCGASQGKRNDASFPLSYGRAGEALRIARMPPGKGVGERLAGMGIQPGDTVLVVQNQGGSLLIETGAGSRFVVGGGMADKIFVTRG